MTTPGPEITIRAFHEDDVPALVALLNLPKVHRNTLGTPFESVERMRKFRAATTQPVTLLAACVEGQMIGTASLHRNTMARLSHAAGIGICVHDDWQGQGIGRSLFKALIDLADNWLGLTRLELDVFTDNAAAIALYRKFGFQIEATHIADTFRDGAYVDSHVMARLRGSPPCDLAPYPAAAPSAPFAAFLLRPAEPEDAAGIAEIMGQPLARHGTLQLPFCTPEDVQHLAAPPDAAVKSIVAVSANIIIGIAILKPGKGRMAHTGSLDLIAIHDAWLHRGIGAALLAAVLDIANNWLNLRRVHLRVMADNAAAIALYEKYGFVSEGRLRADVFRAGAYADALVMARTKPGA